MVNVKERCNPFYCNDNIDEKGVTLSNKQAIRLMISYIKRDHQCFRTLFHYRMLNAGKLPFFWMILRSVVLRLFHGRDDFFLWVGEIEPGGVFFHHPFATIINAEHIGYGCTFRNGTTVGNKMGGVKLFVLG